MPDEPQQTVTAPHPPVLPGQPAVQPPPAPAPPQAPPPPAAPPPPTVGTVTIPLTQLEALVASQARIATLEAEQRERERLGREKEIQLMTEKGQAVEAVKTLREAKDAELKLANEARVATGDRAKRYALESQLAQVLATKPLHQYAAGQLTNLWRKEFLVTEDGEGFTVRTPTFQTVDQFVTAELTKPDYAHFLRAMNPQGGTGAATSGVQGAPTQGQPPPPKDYKNLGEFLIDQTLERQKAQGTDARTNVNLPLGIHPKAG